jgi:gamma-glutamyltranspeptidase
MPDQGIATPHAEATAAGLRAFERGGNALDAALAAAAVLTVVYPHNCALGGDLFALVRDADGTTASVNASGPAARSVDVAALRRRGDTMPETGPDTITVPGLVAGWERIHALGAALAWEDALSDAATLAADGVPVAPSLGTALADADLDGDPGMQAVFAPGGRALRTGDHLRQPALAATLRRLAAAGARDFYDGELGQRLADGLAACGSQVRPGDLRGFAADVTPPLAARFGELDLLTSPPNASGVLLLQALAAVQAADLDDPLGNDAGVLAEIFRAGAEDRDRLLGDPRTGEGGAAELLAAERVEAIVDRAVRAAAGDRAAAPVQRNRRPTGDTVAVVAVDADGRAVSLIQSLFHAFGAGILDPGTGVLLHNRGSFFTLADGHPNALLPGRRPAHTLMPVLVEHDGALRGVLGTMGGKVHAQILTHVLLALRAGVAPQEAVDAPRWIVGGMEAGERDDTVRIEDGVGSGARRALEQARLRLVDVPRDSEWLGHAQAIWLAPDVAVGSDRRADG